MSQISQIKKIYHAAIYVRRSMLMMVSAALILSDRHSR